MNNEQIGVPSISSTSAATGGALSSQEQLLKAISIGHDAGINNATNDDEDANIATLNSNKIQAVVPDTPIVSIAGGTLSESTSTTTSTKTTPTPYPQEQLTTLMSHNVKQEQHPTNNNDDRKQSPDSVSNHNTSCNNNANVDASPNQAAATEAAFANTATSTGTARSRIASTHPNLKLSPLLSKSGQPAPEVIAAATALHQRRGATTKGKTQDDQNVGKRQKKKKTKYDAWEDSDFNDLDDASLKKLLEEAYWYRNPGDRKNKSERFLQMLKKAEYDEENSYRAIKTCLSATHNSSNNNNSSSTSTTAGNNYSSSYHRSASAAQRHKQGGSLQDLVEAAHRSELATTSAAAAAAAASVTQRFNCDYQLGGNRSNRRQQQHQQLLQQQRIRINNNNNNNHHQHHHHHHSSSSSNNNSSVSARQREGGSLPSSVNLESISMDGKLKQSLGGEHASTASGHGHGKGSSSSLPTQLSEAQMSLISTQFDMDEDDTAANDQMLEESDVSKKLKLLSNANNPSMSFKTEKLFNQQMQLPESNKDSGGAAVQEFLIDDPLTFSMLEISAKNQQLQQQLQQQLMQQQQMQPQYFPAGPMNAAASGIGGQFTITMDEQRRRIDPGYVSLNDSYTACSSVYGAPSCSNANSSEAASKASSCGNSADSDLRPAKMGRMMSAAAAAAVAASHGAKATSRQFDENGNALSDASLASSSSSSGANQFQTLISNSMAAGSNSGQLQRSNGISTQLASGSTTAMAAAAVAASLNSQLQQGPMMAGALMAAHGQTKLKLKKKSQQERNTTTVDVMSVAGYRGNDPIEQLVKYIENEEKNGMQQQKKKERKQKQSKLKKCNSLEELRSCAKMEVDELKHQSATTDQMMRNSKKNGNGNSSSSNGKHNSASVADISKNCNKEQQQQQQQQQQPAAQPATGRKSERRSWGTEELQYLGEPLSAVVKPAATAAWAECAAAELSAHPIVPMPLPLSELEALNTVLCETAEFHVVTKKKKPKKQRAVTMDDAAVAAAAHTGGNLQRMQQITKSASSNMMSQRLRGSIDYYNNGNHYAVKQPPQQQQYQQQQQHQQQQQQQHQQQSTAAQDNSRRKSTSSMPPSEKSDSSDLDSVHSLPIQTGKKKSNNKRTVAPVKHNSNTNSHNKTNSNSSPPAPISYADIARNKLEALANAGDDLDTGHNEVLPLPEAKPKLKAKQRPDFPELPGATVVIATAAAAAAATSSSSSSISYSQSLNATPPSSGSSDAETTPETTPSVTVTPTTATATAPTTTSTSSNTNIVTTANVATSTNSAPPPALQKSRSVEHDASGYSFNSSNLDLQYPALEKTVKRHSASNVSLPASNSALSFNFAAAARQLTDKSSLDATSSSTSSSKLSLSSASTSSGSSSSSIKSKSASKELSPSASSKKDKPVIKPSQELEEQAPPPPAPAKVTAATQTDSAKKYCSSNSGASSSANSSSSSGSMSLGSGPRPAVIILNDDRDSALGRLNNEFIFGDFNEDELKLFDDAGEKDKAKDKKQAEDKPSSVSKPSSSSDSASANSSVSASTSEQQLNDSGAASDVVNSSACLDMLMISGQAAQSSPNTANNSSTSSSASNSTSVSTSSSSSTLSNISCTETIKQLVNQSSDSGIYAQQQQQHQPSSRSNSVQNLHIKDQVNHFLRKANSTQSSCSSMDEPLPQLETCNDIEAAIIAAARAAAAAARSSSCSRSNSQEQKQEEPKVAQPKAKPKSQQASPAKLKSTRPAILMTYSNADAAEDEAELSELSFVAELKSEPPVCEPNRIPTPPPMPPNAMRQALMDNSELIVEYISSSWNAIVNSKYVTFYCEQEEQTI